MVKNMTHKHIRLVVFYTLFTLLTALPPGMARAADKIYVIDGDTFSWNGQIYRLWGIDAVEKNQVCRLTEDYQCGIVARSYLRSLIDPATLTCEVKPKAKKETRIVALCRIDGEDMAQLMVSAGWAVDYKFFSKGYYAAAEASARAARRGLWAGEFQSPQAWRRANPR
jgi:endonuclease YncB( thermonuclease family)